MRINDIPISVNRSPVLVILITIPLLLFSIDVSWSEPPPDVNEIPIASQQDMIAARLHEELDLGRGSELLAKYGRGGGKKHHGGGNSYGGGGYNFGSFGWKPPIIIWSDDADKKLKKIEKEADKIIKEFTKENDRENRKTTNIKKESNGGNKKTETKESPKPATPSGSDLLSSSTGMQNSSTSSGKTSNSGSSEPEESLVDDHDIFCH